MQYMSDPTSLMHQDFLFPQDSSCTVMNCFPLRNGTILYMANVNPIVAERGYNLHVI